MSLSNDRPIVAVKVPLYNAEETIVQLIDSILGQSYQCFVVYIYDNCSTDNSRELIASFNDDRIKYFCNEINHGWNYNFNLCLKNTGEDFLFIAHADDFYHRRYIESNLIVHERGNYGLTFSSGKSFSTYLKPVRNLSSLRVEVYNFTRLFEEVCIRGNFLYCPTAFGKMLIFEELVKSFNGQAFGGSADLDAWFRVSIDYEVALIVTEGLFYHRISSGQISTVARKNFENFFTKCLKSYVSRASSDFYSEDYIAWHDIFHALVFELHTGEISNYVNPTIKGILSLKVKFLKKIKLVVFYLVIRLVVRKAGFASFPIKRLLLRSVR